MSGGRPRGWAAFAALAGVLLVHGRPRAARAGDALPLYTAEELGNLGGGASFPWACNAQGEVTGWAFTESGDRRAFLWRATCPDPPGDCQLGINDPRITETGWNEGRDVNSSGSIAGWTQTPASPIPVAFLWQAGVRVDLGTLGGDRSEAWALNAWGQVVGMSETAAGERHAVLWDVPCFPPTELCPVAMQDLGTLGGIWSEARAVNSLGQVVGWSFNAAPLTRGFLWDAGVMTELGTLGGPHSWAYDINDSGRIAGAASVDEKDVHAAVWIDGGIIDLGTLGGPSSRAWAVNSRGAVVGWTDRLFEDGTGQQRAFIWEGDGLIDLTDRIAGGSQERPIVHAHDINDRDQIVAFRVDAGQMQAVLLTPVPELAIELLTPITFGQVMLKWTDLGPGWRYTVERAYPATDEWGFAPPETQWPIATHEWTDTTAGLPGVYAYRVRAEWVPDCCGAP